MSKEIIKLKQLRHTLIQQLWNTHQQSMSEINLIATALKQLNINTLYLDHFAIIDLPGSKTGIPFLHELFATIGYIEQGRDYLADKQNDFLWMSEIDSKQLFAKDALPQVVVADFRMNELPLSIQKIISKYAEAAKPSPINAIKKILADVYDDASIHQATQQIKLLIENYFQGRDWPLPSCDEYHEVRKFNELLAWVLVNGRRPNHFTLSIHLLDHFNDLNHFHNFIENLGLTLNIDGGKIKGNEQIGIAQGSTVGATRTIALQDGNIEMPGEFVEFVWRYSSKQNPNRWDDYFTGFIAQNADHVIESLYTKETM